MADGDDFEDVMDPSVHAIEDVLSRATAASSRPVPIRNGKAIADRAFWMCACATEDGFDAPTWLVYDTSDGRFGWCRVPIRSDIGDLVDAGSISGDHVHPLSVESWLDNADTKHWPGYSDADRGILRAIGRTIRQLLKD